jgi:hypothetical protein
MRRQPTTTGIRYLWFGLLGAALAICFLLLNRFFHGAMLTSAVRFLCAPALLIADQVLHAIFRHNRVAPSLLEVWLFDLLLVLCCSTLTGVLGSVGLKLIELLGPQAQRRNVVCKSFS